MSTFAYTRTYPLDRRFSVHISIDGGQIECAWSPHVPKGRKARSLLPAYRRARNEFITSLGVRAMVVEI